MRNRVFNFVILFLLGTFVCQGQDPRIAIYLKSKQNGTQTKSLDELFPEWQLSKMKNLCMLISGRVKDSNPLGGYKYLYQRRINEAAKVDPVNDSKEVIAKKISTMWVIAEQLNILICNSTQFDVMDGSLLKYAVSYKFTDFLEDVINWKISLNKVDANDNRTVLDYIRYQLQRNKGNALEEKFQIYYELLRSAGAKHKEEL
jgi:hypothetical protein